MFNVLTAIGIGEAGLTGLLGYAVVFLGLFLLMVVVIVMGKIMSGKKAEKPAKPAPAPVAPVAAAPVAPAAPAPTGNEAPGSAGPCKLYDTPDRDAAMIMAIVAEQTGKPLNELRFKSIKEVK